MGYCVVADVQAEFKSVVFSPSTLVTDTSVNGFILEASALINSKVGTRYLTPITGDTDALALMSLYCRTLVADRVRGILENKQVTNVDANQAVKHLGLTTADVLRGLNDIMNNVVFLNSPTRDPHAGFYSNTAAHNVRPYFHKRTRQW